ncbi:MAG TPA: peptidylprolyl isomerase [Candidatus Limnocylindria bacterium]|nr:peptidylprolyl isomerase [Candidatus Limnocylindria bacterium]
MDRRSLLRRAAAGLVLAACGPTSGTAASARSTSPNAAGGISTNNPTTPKATKATVELAKGGSFSIALRPDKAPQTVERFAGKARGGFYNSLTFHRVEDWVVQGGDPQGDGRGGGRVPSEYNDLTFKTGAVGIARGQDPAFNNDSQFFIVKKDSSFLDTQYTNFGQLTSGMDVVSGITIGDKIKTITIE